jgi:zinc-ribbon domain
MSLLSDRRTAHGVSCPNCGELAEDGQLVCLNCGERLALEGSRPDPWRPATWLVLAVVALGGAASGFAISELTSDEGPAQQRAAAPATDTSEREGEPAASDATETETSETETTPAAGGDWPEGVSAFTVVLFSSSEEPAARRVADEAEAAGIEDAGVLRSEDYGLGQGLWIAYAGQHRDQASAAQEAGELGARYPGAYPQLIEPQAQSSQ